MNYNLYMEVLIALLCCFCFWMLVLYWATRPDYKKFKEDKKLKKELDDKLKHHF